jgi:hypothetical protein
MAVFGLLGKLFGGGSKKPSSDIQGLNTQLQPLVDLQKKFAEYGFPAAQESFGQASNVYDTSLDFYKKILNGSNEDVLGLLNADEYTKSADESEANAYSLAGRSGSRAATLAGINESRVGNLNRIISELRANAPDKIANIGQAIANMGAQQASLATGTSINASNILFGIQNVKTQEADRRAQMIASIIGGASSIAGAAFAASDPELKENIKPMSEVVSKLREVHGVTFDWNLKALALGKTPGTKEAGILADQVHKVFPQLVVTGSDGYKRVNYTTLTALLIEAMKDLDKENQELKAATNH